MLRLLIYLVISYLLGSIPTAYWVGKMIRGVDIRDFGSGNVGATNAFRVLGPALGILVLVVDILKGFLAVKLGQWCFGVPEWTVVPGGIAVIAGHNWTVFLSFKGGKGVATSAGVFCALVPRAFLIAFLVFVLAVAITRYISVGSISAAVVLLITVVIERLADFGDRPGWLVVALTAAAALFVIVRHKANIQRLREGKENRFTLKPNKV